MERAAIFVDWVYLGFLPVAAACFALLRTRRAILLVLIGGWWLLPVADYAALKQAPGVEWLVTGIALPSNMLLTKAWIPALAAFLGASFRDPAALREWRPSPIDLPMLGWCLWPLINHLGADADPARWISSLYLSGAWGLPWLIGRIWLADSQGKEALIKALALSGLANIPVAIIEGARPAMLYSRIYGVHPLQTDGITRYIGYRPVGFFEDGNLYGLWAAFAAFAALWLARSKRVSNRPWIAVAVVNVTVACASQSVGAIALLGLGLIVIALWRMRSFLPLLAGAGALSLMLAAIHLSGVIPVQSLARTPAGEKAIAGMRSIGRGSLLWRVSQDAKTLPTIAAHPIGGSAKWDWWRAYKTRPWGQMFLLVGQFGLVGLFLAWGGLLSAVASAFIRSKRADPTAAADSSVLLGVLVVLALLDALLNAFFFSPAILAAGAIAASPSLRKHRGRQQLVRVND